jgi:hypothetical protein
MAWLYRPVLALAVGGSGRVRILWRWRQPVPVGRKYGNASDFWYTLSQIETNDVLLEDHGYES